MTNDGLLTGFFCPASEASVKRKRDTQRHIDTQLLATRNIITCTVLMGDQEGSWLR